MATRLAIDWIDALCALWPYVHYTAHAVPLARYHELSGFAGRAYGHEAVGKSTRESWEGGPVGLLSRLQ
jgi:hypothetical protein